MCDVLMLNVSATINKKPSKHGKAAIPGTSNSADVSALKGSVSLSDDSSSEAVSSPDSDYESSGDEEDKSPLPATRPSGSIEAAKYDSIKALWRPHNHPATGDDIRDGLKNFWEVFQTIRDRWKSDSADVKQAEDNKKINEVPLLKERVTKQREMAEASLRAALEHGHPDIIEQYVFLPSFACTSSHSTHCFSTNVIVCWVLLSTANIINYGPPSQWQNRCPALRGNDKSFKSVTIIM